LYFKIYLYDKRYVCHFKVTLMRTTSYENKKFADFIANNYSKKKKYHVRKKKNDLSLVLELKYRKIKKE
jgi:hypothetical protein